MLHEFITCGGALPPGESCELGPIGYRGGLVRPGERSVPLIGWDLHDPIDPDCARLVSRVVGNVFEFGSESELAVGVLGGFGQTVGLVGNQHEMDVVGHQAIAEQGHVGALDVLLQQLEVDVAVRIILGDESACVAALGNMMGNFCNDHPGQAWHQEPLMKRSNFAAICPFGCYILLSG